MADDRPSKGSRVALEAYRPSVSLKNTDSVLQGLIGQGALPNLNSGKIDPLTKARGDAVTAILVAFSNADVWRDWLPQVVDRAMRELEVTRSLMSALKSYIASVDVEPPGIFAVPHEWLAAKPAASRRARDLLTSLESIVPPNLHKLNSSATTLYANNLIEEFCQLWSRWTGDEPPRDGGVKLRSVLAALFEDFNLFPVRKSDDRWDMWLKVRFRSNRARKKNNNLLVTPPL